MEGTQRRHNGIRAKFKQVRTLYNIHFSRNNRLYVLSYAVSSLLLFAYYATSYLSLPFLSIIRDTRPSVEATTLLSISSLPKLIDENAQDMNPMFDIIHMSISLDLAEDILIRSVDTNDMGTTSQTGSRPRVECEAS